MVLLRIPHFCVVEAARSKHVASCVSWAYPLVRLDLNFISCLIISEANVPAGKDCMCLIWIYQLPPRSHTCPCWGVLFGSSQPALCQKGGPLFFRVLNVRNPSIQRVLVERGNGPALPRLICSYGAQGLWIHFLCGFRVSIAGSLKSISGSNTFLEVIWNGAMARA